MKLGFSTLLRTAAAASWAAALLLTPLGACDSSGSTASESDDTLLADMTDDDMEEGSEDDATLDEGGEDVMDQDDAGTSDVMEADEMAGDAQADEMMGDEMMGDAMMGDGAMMDTGPMEPTWTSDIQPMMQAYCASCHGFAQSYMSMTFRAGESYAKMKSGSMPPGCQSHGPGCPTTDELATFKAWLDAGTPE